MTLATPQTITIAPVVTVVTAAVTINSLVDDHDQKSVTAEITLGTAPTVYRKRLVLWNATTAMTYTQAGDWTQRQAEDAIAVLLGSTVATY